MSWRSGKDDVGELVFRGDIGARLGLGEQEPGKGCSQQSQRPQQRPWVGAVGGREPAFQEAPGGTEVGTGVVAVGRPGAWSPPDHGEGARLAGVVSGSGWILSCKSGPSCLAQTLRLWPRSVLTPSRARAGATRLAVCWPQHPQHSVPRGTVHTKDLRSLSGLWVLH